MKILLTGSEGFIGSHFIEQAPSDFEIRKIDFKLGKSLKAIEVNDLLDIDVIVHLAAFISSRESYNFPTKYADNNTLQSFTLMQKAVECGVKKFIFASSAAVYADPLSPYGASKLAAEKLLSVYKNDIDLIMLRFFNVYGDGQNKEYAGVIAKFIDAIEQKKPLTIYGDGNQTRDFVHVKDMAKVLINACLTDSKYPEPIDIGKGDADSISRLAGLVQGIWGVDLPIEYKPEQKGIKYSIAKKPMHDLLVNFTSLKHGLQDLYRSTKP